MSLISAEDLHLHFGKKKIFEGDSVAVEVGDRLGVVGPNGAGKSTLLKILAGFTQPDGGRINRAKGIRVGYLSQEHGAAGDESLLDSVLVTAPGKDDVEAELAEVEASLAQAEDADRQMELSERLAVLHQDLAELDRRFGPHRAKAILSGLGFSEADFDRPVQAFSGGWRMRAALAGLLYQQPDVLLLDEPTNHLDLPSVHWLSGYLESVRHAVVITCHDREFLNRHVRRVASLELEGLKTFRGNYDDYVVQRATEIAHLEARMEKEAERQKQLEAFVERFRAKASKARQAQSKAKMIERMEAERVELPELRRAMHVRFEPVPKSADTVLRLERLTFGYVPGQTVLGGVDGEVRRGDRVAVVGVNGAGKTTLLRLVAGELEAEEGGVERGRHVALSYFAQHHSEALALGRTILEEVRAANPEASETKVRALCGAVLFTGDDVDKKVEVLSGGEKARVALARMLATPANLLLLDEPTNHLDTESADVLTESLEGFDGTILFVSHNLDFARRLSTKVWDVSGGKIEAYPGDLGAYLEHLETRQAELRNTFAQQGMGGSPHQVAEAKPVSVTPGRAPGASSKAERIAAREARKKAETERKRRVRAVEEAVARAESAVAQLEREKEELEGKLEDASVLTDPEALRRTSEQLGEVSQALEGALETWAEAEAERESLGD